MDKKTTRRRSALRKYDQKFEALTPAQRRDALALLYDFIFRRGDSKRRGDIRSDRGKIV